MKKISILGVGWLGEALFKALVVNGDYEVAGSSRSAEKRERLATLARQNGQEAKLYDISVPDQLAPEAAFWFCDVLIITIPPRRGRENVTEIYPQKIQFVIDQAKAAGVQHIIYTSSTGVYGEREGLVTESTPIAPITESAKGVTNVEARLTMAGLPVTILRLAGLFGPNRHPGRWFARREKIPSADAPVNLVHQQDVVQAIQLAIKQPPSTGTQIHNVCAVNHPSKGDFYRRAILDIGAEVPTLVSGGAAGKRVDSKKIRQVLGWQPIHDDLTIFN